MSLTEADDIPTQPSGLISEIVHYVRLVREPDPVTGEPTGPFHEVNAIVTALYANGAALHVFVDPASSLAASPPQTRTLYSETPRPDSWHRLKDCTHR